MHKRLNLLLYLFQELIVKLKLELALTTKSKQSNSESSGQRINDKRKDSNTTCQEKDFVLDVFIDMVVLSDN